MCSVRALPGLSLWEGLAVRHRGEVGRGSGNRRHRHAGLNRTPLAAEDLRAQSRRRKGGRSDILQLAPWPTSRPPRTTIVTKNSSRFETAVVGQIRLPASQCYRANCPRARAEGARFPDFPVIQPWHATCCISIAWDRASRGAREHFKCTERACGIRRPSARRAPFMGRIVRARIGPPSMTGSWWSASSRWLGWWWSVDCSCCSRGFRRRSRRIRRSRVLISLAVRRRRPMRHSRSSGILEPRN